MSVLTARPIMRWLIPAAAAVAVIGGGAAIGVITAAADPSLPPRSPQQLLVDLQTAKVDGLSGTVVERADLGLPPLPSSAADGSPDLGSIVSGTHTLKLWYSGPDHARLALVGTLGETDVISDGHDLWIWMSKDNTVVHQTLTPGAAGTAPGLPKGLPKGLPSGLPKGLPSGLPSVLPSGLPGGLGAAGAGGPDQLAMLALTALGSSTSITSSGTTSVAGRDAYELILAPKDVVSRIGSVRVAIDAVAHVPLRVQIFARGVDTAAVEAAFTQVSFARPDAAEFVFNPPPGATTVQRPAETPPTAAPSAGTAPKTDAAKKFAVLGKGWASVLVTRVPKPAAGTDNAGSAELTRVLASLPTVSGTWGSGKILSGTLFGVLLTDDGRLLVGAVGPEQLYQAAADPAARLPA